MYAPTGAYHERITTATTIEDAEHAYNIAMADSRLTDWQRSNLRRALGVTRLVIRARKA